MGKGLHSKLQSHTHLEDSGGQRSQNFGEVGSVINGSIGSGQVRMIKEIERLRAKLETNSFVQGEVLHQTEIPILQVRSAERAAVFVPECSWILRHESTWIKPVVPGMHAGGSGTSWVRRNRTRNERIPHLVRALLAEQEDSCRITKENHG